MILSAFCLATVLLQVTLAQQNGDIRLVNGPSTNAGRVEVYYDGVWGTVCDDSWNTRDADVVCRQLGFEGAEKIFYRAKYGEGKGPIWIDQIDCQNEPQSLLECFHNGWGVHDCRHREDAAVECKRKVPTKPAALPVRLSCPEFSSCGTCRTCADKRYPDPTDCLPQRAVEGIVETFYNNEWRPVSADGWDANAARVVCGELGFPFAMGMPSVEQLWCNWDRSECGLGSGSGPLTDRECIANEEFSYRLKTKWIRGLECSGAESKLLDCFFEEFGPIRTPTIADVATLRCGYYPHPQCSSGNPNTEVYRTRGSAVPWEGRVEARINGEWGTITDYLWDTTDASIVCRALGYGTAKQVTYFGSFGRGVGKIHLSHLQCKGSEFALSRCASVTGREAENLGHLRDAGVICNIPDRVDCDTPSSRIVSQPETNGYTSNFVQVHHQQHGWGFLCFNASDMTAANVICRETSNSFAYRMRGGAHPDFTARRYKATFKCSGEESSLRECSTTLELTQCSHETVLECRPDLPDLVPELNSFRDSLLYYPYVDTSLLYYLRCAHEEKCLSSSADGKPFDTRRNLLRFSSLTMNFGRADFVPVLDRSEWIWHSCHNHFHSFEAFIHYDLIDPASGEKVAEGHKASFCLEDSYCERGGSPSYRCSTGHQGISRNCGDLYDRHLDCQWIDITDVRPGTYILRQTVNPDRLALETDYRNNVEECTVRYLDGGYLFLVSGSCHLSDH